MKRFVFYLIFVCLTKIGAAQSILATGTVNNEQGNPVPFAFITDQKTQNATYTDSTGTFKLNVNPVSTLIITCNGYKTATANVDNKNNLKIILSPGVAATRNATNFNNTGNFEIRTQLVDVLGMISEKSTKEETHGSRYLFDDWMHGYVVDNNGAIIQDQHNLFNYDKIGGGLLMTLDKSTAMEISKEQIKSFTIFDKNTQPYIFENVPTIDSKHYVQLISAGKNVKIYKVLGTKFERANFSTNGMMSTGHNYDLYTEKSTYYVVKAQGGNPQKLALSKKAIKDVFADQGDKVNKFISTNSNKDIDDNYLKELGDYLNE
jgi:hypothetical protein